MAPQATSIQSQLFSVGFVASARMKTIRAIAQAAVGVLALACPLANAQGVGAQCLELLVAGVGGAQNTYVKNRCEFPVTVAWCIKDIDVRSCAGGRAPSDICWRIEEKSCGDSRSGLNLSHQALEPFQNFSVFFGRPLQRATHVVMEACRGRDVKARQSGGSTGPMVCEGGIGATTPGTSDPGLARPAGVGNSDVAPTPRPRQYANRGLTPDLEQSRGMLQQILRDVDFRSDAELDRQILPVYRAASRAAQRAFQQAGELKKTKLHRNANDATQCLQVERTGTQVEWGIEGRFRIVNRCNYQVEASWCANTSECTQGFGSTWKLDPGFDWPIYFSDPDSPFIRVGGCRTEANRIPLPSDAALRQPGAVNTRHNDPLVTPGVGRMQGHICE